MPSQKHIFLFLLFSQLFLIFCDPEIQVNYGKGNDPYKIKDLRPALFNTHKDGIYYLGNSMIAKSRTIIAFTDLNGDKLTDIFTYKEDTSNSEFTFYVQYYDKDSASFKEEEEKFKLIPSIDDTPCSNCTVRNVYIGAYPDEALNISAPFYIVSFNNLNNNLIHYLVFGDKKVKLSFSSNIIIADINGDGMKDILFYDYEKNTRRICKLNSFNEKEPCEIIDFSDVLGEECKKDASYNDVDLSLYGGSAVVDINGDCIGDLIITHEDEDDNRIIEIYLGYRNEKDKKKYYCLNKKTEIKLPNSESYGALTLSSINDKKSKNIAPMFDLLIPIPCNNSVLIIFNQKKEDYDWTDKYCDVYDKKHKGENDDTILFEYNINDRNKARIEPLVCSPLPNNVEEIVFDTDYPTIIRAGDFKSAGNNGVLVNQKFKYKDGSTRNFINLYSRKDGAFVYYTGIDISEVNTEGDEPLFALFFDIDEQGQLGVIVESKKKNSYFFYNFKRNGFFVKTKLMNSEKNYFNTDIGTTYRYIVTDSSGERYMDISYQLIQNSDMNIPLPYSLMGLDETNNYVEYFHTISNTYLQGKYKYYDSISGDIKQNTPVIPNTQMMLHKYIKDKTKIEWLSDLVVQPMDKIWLFLFIVAFVSIIVLVIVIYLHIKEIKEEQKEANKFKSWFA